MKIASIIAICLITLSCKKQELKSDLEIRWENCREEWSEEATQQKLIGRWKMVAVGCAYCERPGIGFTTENVELQFSADGVVSTFVESVAVKTSNFRLKESYNSNFFSLETIPAGQNTYTWGVIEFCKNGLVFKSSYVDSGDFYFERMK